MRIPCEIKDRIAQVIRKFELKVREANLVTPDNLHITLKFLGTVSEDRISRISEILTDIVKDFPVFKAEVKGVGVFPDVKAPRVFWVGVDSAGILKRLNHLIEDRLEQEGFTKEDRFREHITIVRFKIPPRVAFLQEIIEKYREESFGVMDVREIELIKSDLTRYGPTYTTLTKGSFQNNLERVYNV